jgi:hemerythrin-like domain-containing protein
MFATEILRKEHDAILKMLDALDQTSVQLLGGASVQLSTLQDLLEFFQLFADRCHHGKEEDLLFPLLERRGIPRERGPIGVMLSEHDQGRELMQQMKAAVGEYEKAPQAAGKRWSEAARVYSQLLREHIMKENNILFRMAEQVLSPEEQTSLAADFEKAEIEKMGPGTHERLHARMGHLLEEIHRTNAAVR